MCGGLVPGILNIPCICLEGMRKLTISVTLNGLRADSESRDRRNTKCYPSDRARLRYDALHTDCTVTGRGIGSGLNR